MKLCQLWWTMKRVVVNFCQRVSLLVAMIGADVDWSFGNKQIYWYPPNQNI